MKPKAVSASAAMNDNGILYTVVCSDGTMWSGWDDDDRGFQGWTSLPAIPHCEESDEELRRLE